MNLASHHLQNPASLTPSRPYSPAIAVYPDVDVQMTVGDETISLIVGEKTITVSYVGKSLEEIASEIATSSSSVTAHALAVAHRIQYGFLYFDDETSGDGGLVIRMRSHVVRYTEETRIRALPPYSEHRMRPWYPIVDRGSVVVDKSGAKFVFSIPEYQRQEWSPTFGAPFVDDRGARPEYINERLIRLPRRPIFWFRNNIELYVNDIPVGSSIIEDVDIYNGFLRLTTALSPQDRVIVNYTYREDRLVYKEVNLNPSIEQNPGILDHAVVLYLLPTASSLGYIREKAVRHVVAKTILGAVTTIPVSGEPSLVIGAYQVRASAVIADLVVRDVRKEGGGVREDRMAEAIKRNEEARSFSDVGRYDGIPFPAATTSVVKIERSMLERVPQDLMERLIRKHLAAGSHILLDFD